MPDMKRDAEVGPVRSSESYVQAGNASFESLLSSRTVVQDAAFLLPYLTGGLRLLDLGCGPGSITVGLGTILADGQVVGVDIQPSQVERARALALEQGQTNVHFEVADAYALPFPSGYFDVVFANGVLMHLREPQTALGEVCRVLRPGGIAAVRDPDFGASLFTPLTPTLERWSAVRARLREGRGSDPFTGRQHRRLLLDAGFAGAEAGATAVAAGTLEETQRFAAFLIAQTEGFATAAIAEGLADDAILAEVKAELEAWGRRPDAFSVTTWCHAVGWAPV